MEQKDGKRVKRSMGKFWISPNNLCETDNEMRLAFSNVIVTGNRSVAVFPMCHFMTQSIIYINYYLLYTLRACELFIEYLWGPEVGERFAFKSEIDGNIYEGAYGTSARETETNMRTSTFQV